MYWPEGVASLICHVANANVLFTSGGKFVWPGDRATHLFARGGGNFEFLALMQMRMCCSQGAGDWFW